MARRRSGDLEFGSDSFLDIVANVVGILIILIVVAAVRVSRAPVTAQELATHLPPVAAPAPAPPVHEDPKPEPEPLLAGPALAPPAPEVAEPAPLPAPPLPPEPSPELEREARRWEQELARLQELRRQRLADLEQASTIAESLRDRQTDEEKSLLTLEASRSEQARRRAEFEGTIDEIAGQVALARRQLESLEKNQPAATPLRHKVTPISRVVKGAEFHFHLSRNRVAFVPLDDLVERLRTQVSRQKEWLSKYRRHQGEVGPVQGFSLRYIVERQDGSVLDELQDGVGMMRIGVSQWQVLPDAELHGESAEEALRQGSSFLRALRKVGTDSTLTFWVYPDSFDLYRALTQFAHREGFTVAARPLPAGVPIAGSPNGSRSAGQ